jgi:diguanylate cyclase (GGDEF)-like protein
MSLDLATLQWVFFAAQLIMAAAMLYMMLLHRQEVAPPYWAGSALLSSLGAMLLALHADVGGDILLMPANLLILLAFWLNWSGVRRFLDLPIFWPVILAAVVVQLSYAFWFTFVEPMMWVRMMLNSALFGLVCLAFGVDIARHHRHYPRASLIVLVVIHLAFAGLFLLRSVMVGLEQPTGPYIKLTGVAALGLLVGMVFTYFCTVSYVMILSEKQQSALAKLALTDGLTGLLNRRAFTDQANAAIARAQRSRRPAALLLLDIDRFKSINDCFGHLTGDAVLKAVASALGQGLRAGDLLARAGGEEFAALLPEADEAQALEVANRLRLAVSTLGYQEAGVTIPTSVSIGVAQLSSGDNFDALFGRADAALYRAKSAGRDRVIVAPVQPLVLALA